MLSLPIQNLKLPVAAIAVMYLINAFSTTCGIYAATRKLDYEAKTLYYTNIPSDKQGHFHYEFQTSNGITTKSKGNQYGFSGVIQYVSLEGIPITMTYVADEDGYHPVGDFIPKIPEYILKSLEYIRTHSKVDERKSRQY